MSDKKLTAIKYWPTWLGLAVLKLLSFLPLFVLALLGYVLGCLFFLLHISRRNIALKNIRTCFPEYSRYQTLCICLKNFTYMGQTMLCAGMNLWMSKARLKRLVTVQNRQGFDFAVEQGRNVIILAPHFLGLDIGGYILSKDLRMITMYQYTKNLLMNEVVKNGRKRFDGILVERKEPLRNLIRLIRKGHPFYYLPDQDAGRKGVFVPFFQTQASTFSMLGKFTKMTDAVVIPCQTRIKPWGQGYEVILGDAIDNFATGDEAKDTRAMNLIIEQMIEKMPEQYFWVHKRFKTRPAGESKFYI